VYIDISYTFCYTINVKTAISIDKGLYEVAENYSRSIGVSRSRLYSNAIKEYLQNRTPDFVTEKMNEYYGKNKSELPEDLKTAAYHLFDQVEW